MTFPRLFSPTVTSRLFDPMPLPRSVRIKRIGRIKTKLPRTSGFKAIQFSIKKIPVNR